MTEQEAREIAEKIKEFLKSHPPAWLKLPLSDGVKVIACDENWFPLEMSFAE